MGAEAGGVKEGGIRLMVSIPTEISSKGAAQMSKGIYVISRSPEDVTLLKLRGAGKDASLKSESRFLVLGKGGEGICMYWLIRCMLLQIKKFLSRRNRLFPSCIIKEVQEYGEHGVHQMLRKLEVTLTKHGLDIYSLVTIVSCRLTGASFVLRDGNMPHSTEQAMHTTSSRQARIMIEDRQHIWRDGAAASALRSRYAVECIHWFAVETLRYERLFAPCTRLQLHSGRQRVRGTKVEHSVWPAL